MHGPSYQELYEKYARRERRRALAGIVAGALGIAANIVALKMLRDERKP